MSASRQFRGTRLHHFQPGVQNEAAVAAVAAVVAVDLCGRPVRIFSEPSTIESFSPTTDGSPE